MILCLANLLHHLHLQDYSITLRHAIEKVIKEGKVRTRDVGGYASTRDFTFAVIDHFNRDFKK